MSEPSESAADFAAQWQAANPGGGQVDISADSDGQFDANDIGPTIFADSEPD